MLIKLSYNSFLTLIYMYPSSWFIQLTNYNKLKFIYKLMSEHLTSMLRLRRQYILINLVFYSNYFRLLQTHRES